MSRLDNGENGGPLDDQFLDANIFHVEAIPDYLEQIVTYLATGQFLVEYTTTQMRHLVVKAAEYQPIAGKLYKMGLDHILRRCVLDHEREDILWECHNGVAGGHVGVKPTARKIIHAGLWWPIVHKYSMEYVKKCYVCQRTGRPSHRDELPLKPVRAMQAF